MNPYKERRQVKKRFAIQQAASFVGELNKLKIDGYAELDSKKEIIIQAINHAHEIGEYLQAIHITRVIALQHGYMIFYGYWDLAADLLIKAVNAAEHIQEGGHLSQLIMSLAYVVYKKEEWEKADQLLSDLEVYLLIWHQNVMDDDEAEVDEPLVRFIVNQLATLNLQKGKLRRMQGRYDEAERLLDDGYDLKKYLDDAGGVVSLLEEMAALEEEQGNYFRASIYHKENWEYRLNSGLLTGTGKAAFLMRLGKTAMREGRFVEALSYYKKSLAIREEMNDQIGISYVMHQLGLLAYQQDEFESAIRWYIKSYKIKSEFRAVYDSMPTLMHLSQAHFRLKQYEEAVQWATQLRDIAHQLGSVVYQNHAYSLLAMAYRELGEYDRAKSSLLTCLSYHEALDDKEMVAAVLEELGAISVKLNDPRGAEDYYKSAISRYVELENNIAVAESFWGLGKLYNSQGRFKEALPLLNATLEIGKREGALHLVKANEDMLEAEYRSMGCLTKLIYLFFTPTPSFEEVNSKIDEFVKFSSENEDKLRRHLELKQRVDSMGEIKHPLISNERDVRDKLMDDDQGVV